MKKKLLVIAPGRGSYTKDSLNYLRHFSSDIKAKVIHPIDQLRKENNLPTLTEMDQVSEFIPKWHLYGEHASSLIWGLALSDYLSINKEKYDVEVMIGNSMGWYLALSLSGSLNLKNSYHLIQTMGSMLADKLIGGQIVYSLVDENWRRDLERELILEEMMNKVNGQLGHVVFVSIHLGGLKVIAGTEAGLSLLMQLLPKVGQFPFKLLGHGAYHTPMLQSVSDRAFSQIKPEIFNIPKNFLVDGDGKIWSPFATNLNELYNYTLGQQVVAPYSFTKSLMVGLKEFAPDNIVLLGPGHTLGSSIIQTLIELNYQGISSKEEFLEYNKKELFFLSMGIKEQREILL
jgi:[acyl-carrier-protein] S-malonyltransferase